MAVRTRGLWAGIDIDPALMSGREMSEAMLAKGVLVKDTHGSTIRLAPPLRHRAGGPRVDGVPARRRCWPRRTDSWVV